ncbi:hypothetical protein IU433_14140 [Nocardia puris]|uniref:hypothetical protein n=1 Tax=Nocardia puris TaxID=208602 RepID=UPI001893E196|nr:hypothetical protein [Nocardia puris]MBF6460177.1 hypothetical protein [Nocardia puris]
MTTAPEEVIDPDPFSIGLGIFGAACGAAAWLEARRARLSEAARERNEFRSAWFRCHRSVNFLDATLKEFSTHVHEQEISSRSFLFGSVRIGFRDRNDPASFARLSRQVDTTKSNITENFNNLSDFLGRNDQSDIEYLMEELTRTLKIPGTYGELIRSGTIAVSLLRDFLTRVGSREDFSVE